MNRFVLVYCLELLLIVIALFLPSNYEEGITQVIFIVVFFVLFLVMFSMKEGRNFDTQLMSVLLIPIFLKSFGNISTLTQKKSFDEFHSVVCGQLIGKHRDDRKGGYIHYLDYHFINDYMSIYVT